MDGVRFIPCKICSAPSTGFHFGALTCEACKAFFRRVLKSGATLQTLQCSGADPSPIDPLNPSNQLNGNGLDANEAASNQPGTSSDQSNARRCDLAFSPKKCPKCRYQRCLEIGMGPSASKIGRPTKGRVAEVREELHRIKPWLEFKQSQKDDGISSSAENLGVDARSASLLMLAGKDGTRKRPSFGVESAAKRRHPSMPATVYYSGASSSQSATTAGLQAAAFAAHVRHFSGDVIDSKYRPYLGMNINFDDADEDDDGGDEEEFGFIRNRNITGDFPSPSSSTAATNSSAAPTGMKRELFEPPLALLNAPVQPHPSAMLTVIQQYNNSGGNRQRFVQSLRDSGADREGSSLHWLYQSADQWFDIANVMFQSPLAMSSILSPGTSSASSSMPPPPAPTTLAQQPTRLIETDPLKILSQFAVAQSAPSSQPLRAAPPTSSVIPPSLAPFPHLASAVNASFAPSSSHQQSPLLASSAFSPWPHALRSETMARQVVQATKHLASLNLSRQGLRPGSLNLSAPDLWGFLMQNFEANTSHIIAFARSIPGYSLITSAPDRAVLSMNSFFPLLFANMSIEFDPVSENIRLYWMSNENADDSKMINGHSSNIPNSHDHSDANSPMKTSNLTVVEFGFLCALIHFNPGIRGLQDPISVEMVASELNTAAEYFINTNFPNNAASAAVRVAFPAAFLSNGHANNSPASPAALRLAELNRLVSFFRNLNTSSNWISSELNSKAHQEAIQCVTSTSSADATVNESSCDSDGPPIPNNCSQQNQSIANQNSEGSDVAVIQEMYRKMFELIASSGPTNSSNNESVQQAAMAAAGVHFDSSPPSSSANFLQQFLPRLVSNNMDVFAQQAGQQPQ